MVKVEADEVAPSLKFTTTRAERASSKGTGGTGKGGQFNDEPPF